MENTNIIQESARALGRLGGKTTLNKYGKDHFRKIAKLPRKYPKT